MTQPCKRDCPGRSPTCHAECEKYLQYSEKNAVKRQERYLQGDVAGAVYASMRRMKKSAGKR